MSRDEIIAAASGGNEAAACFLRVYWTRAHLLDDLVDRDKPVLDEQLALSEFEWMVVLTQNEFFLPNKDRLLGVMAIGLNGWVDSNRAASPIKDVLKGQWHEVIRVVALLTGGWRKLREFSPGYRLAEYDWEGNGTERTERTNVRLVSREMAQSEADRERILKEDS